MTFLVWMFVFYSFIHQVIAHEQLGTDIIFSLGNNITSWTVRRSYAPFFLCLTQLVFRIILPSSTAFIMWLDIPSSYHLFRSTLPPEHIPCNTLVTRWDTTQMICNSGFLAFCRDRLSFYTKIVLRVSRDPEYEKRTANSIVTDDCCAGSRDPINCEFAIAETCGMYNWLLSRTLAVCVQWSERHLQRETVWCYSQQTSQGCSSHVVNVVNLVTAVLILSKWPLAIVHLVHMTAHENRRQSLVWL